MMAETCDLAIVGGGPAGQAAAEVAVAAGLGVAVIDEQARPGGQILRQPPHDFAVERWLAGRSYRGLKAQLTRFGALTLDWIGWTSVAGAFPDGDGWLLQLAGRDGGRTLAARRLLIAGGCYDLPFPLPGWTLPGVLSAGGVQAFVKSQQFVPGARFVFAGTHPLQLLVASQILAAGGEVEAVLFAQARGRLTGALRRASGAVLGGGGALMAGAAAYRALRRANVPILFGAPLAEIEGSARVESVRWSGRLTGTAACDTVGLCFGFVPQSDLVRAIGADVRWIGTTGGYAARPDEWQRSNVPGCYVAGETTGVAGAEAALCAGRIAGLAIACDSGRIAAPAAETQARPLRARLARHHRFAAMLDRMADPTDWAMRGLAEDTIVCRCEDVTFGALEAALRDSPAAPGASGLKLVTRAGMGLCQGRSCEHAVLRLLARHNGTEADALDGFHARFPARPVAIGDLIA
jgi:thioredoxin reductase